MLSIPELIQKFPSAKMDTQKQMISIPIQEYENYRNILSLQDKQSIIRDLQKLLLNKEADLQRYKDKCELQESVLQRTQKALDKRIQIEQGCTSLPLKTTVNRQQKTMVQLKRSDPKPKKSSSSGQIEMVPRAVGDAESTPIVSLPDHAKRPGLIEDSSNIKSLPPSLGIGSPGMSTALLKRLVQENLKLKAQLDKRQLPKASKNVEELEKVISDLKVKLLKKQQVIDDLLNQSGSNGQVASRLEALHKENNSYMDTIEMDKIVINALKQENIQYKREKDEMENLVIQYRQFKSVADDGKVSELERKLTDETDMRKSLESRIEVLKQEVEKLKRALEKAEESKELAVKNYNMLASQYHKSDRHSTAQPAFVNQTPQLSGGQLSTPPSSILPQGYSVSQSMYAQSQHHHPRTQVLSRAISPHSNQARKVPDSYTTPKSVAQPTQESTASRMSQSVYPTPTYQATASPLPADRKTFKCPRCDTKFTILQGYRDHIKVCLKG